MAKTAIVSDIHGNLEALSAVVAHAKSLGVERFYCLGDVVGYGADPIACLDICRDFDFCLLGNHENGVLFPAQGFSSQAERSTEWTREQILTSDSELQPQRWAFLNRLPRTVELDDMLFVHGSVVGPLSDYVFPEDANDRRRMERLFLLIPRICFQGHTHIPGVFTQDGRFLTPTDLPEGFGIGESKTMVNAGSVGQPRDGDWRASYLTLDGDWIEFQRVEYDVETAANKVAAIPELGTFFSNRLRAGR